MTDPQTTEIQGKKKGLHPMAWVGIGCGGILVLVLVVLALLVGKCKRAVDDIARNPDKFAAEMIVKTNPEMDLIRSDEVAGTITYKDKDGNEITVGYKDLAEGKLTVESEAGETVAEFGSGGGLEKLPDWFEVPGGVSGWKSLMHMEQGEKLSGTLSGQSPLSPEDLGTAFAENLVAAGFVQKSKFETGGVVVYHFQKDPEGRQVNLTLTPGQDGKVGVQLSYNLR